MELREALVQISQIREQLARGEVFRGYRSATVGFSGILALLTAVAQPFIVPAPLEQFGTYLALWVSVAVVSALVAGIEMLVRARASGAGLHRQLTTLAAEQFLPCVIAGALLTTVVATRAQELAWALPGLWCMIFSLGVFASYRVLPRQVFWIGCFYLVCGVACLSWASGSAALSPWAMGLPFGVGQLLAAGVLYWTLERKTSTLERNHE